MTEIDPTDPRFRQMRDYYASNGSPRPAEDLAGPRAAVMRPNMGDGFWTSAPMPSPGATGYLRDLWNNASGAQRALAVGGVGIPLAYGGYRMLGGGDSGNDPYR